MELKGIGTEQHVFCYRTVDKIREIGYGEQKQRGGTATSLLASLTKVALGLVGDAYWGWVWGKATSLRREARRRRYSVPQEMGTRWSKRSCIRYSVVELG